jgi:hypothetical protein
MIAGARCDADARERGGGGGGFAGRIRLTGDDRRVSTSTRRWSRSSIG